MAYGWNPVKANQMLDAMFRGISFTPPGAVWAELHIGDPGVAGTANISSVTTRQQITCSAASGGGIVISGVPSWGNWAGTSPETLVGLSLWDLVTAGVFIKSVPLVNAITITTGQPLTLPTFTDTFAGVAA